MDRLQQLQRATVARGGKFLGAPEAAVREAVEGGGGGQGWQEPNAAALVAGETVVGSGGHKGGGMGEGGQVDGPPRGGGEAGPASIAAGKQETAPTTPVYTSEG